MIVHTRRQTALAFFALLGVPLTFAACGFALGLVEALLYNLFASRLGGMDLTLEQ